MSDEITLRLSRADADLIDRLYHDGVDSEVEPLITRLWDGLAALAEGPERFDEAIPATGAPLERVGYEVVFAYPDELAAVRAAAKRDGLTVGAWIKHAAMRAAEGPERAATGETGE